MSKVLIVDDEPLILRHVSKLITSFGFEAGFIPKGDYLFKRLENEGLVSLILLDVNMPGIDGLTLLKQLKEDALYKDIPVIMLTGETDDAIFAQCFELGATDYITKPIRELVLKARVSAAIAAREALVKLEEQARIIEKKNEDITSSITYAKRIQRSILPEHDILKSRFQESFVLYKPKDIVSGDFYWFLDQPEKKRFVLAVADCTGHGVPGAFMSMLGANALNHIIDREMKIDPAAVLTALNIEVILALRQGLPGGLSNDGMDIGLVVFDFDNKELSFAGAHHPLFKINAGGFEAIKGQNLCIGGRRDKYEADFVTTTVKFEKGDVFYMLTDGYSDQFGGPDNRKFMKKQFRDLICEIYASPMKQQMIAFNKANEAWKGEGKQTDDILIVGVKI